MMPDTTRRLRPLRLPALVLAFAGLAACADGGVIGGGGGGCGVELTAVEGAWIGPGSFLPGGGTVLAMIAEGEISILQLVGSSPLNDPITERIYLGTYDPVTLVGSASEYNAVGSLVSSTREVRITITSTLNVTVGTAQTLLPLCPFSDNTGASLYDRDSVVEDEVSGGEVNLLPGTYQLTIPAGANQDPYTLTYNFDGAGLGGGLGGDDTLGCVYNGNWRDPDPEHNLYHLEDMTLSSVGCDTSDTRFQGTGYRGHAYFLDATPFTANNLWTVVGNDQSGYFIRVTRESASPLPPPPTGGGGNQFDDEDDF